MLARRPQPSRRAVVRVASIPAPTGGLNGRDNIAAMEPTDALVLENFFPEPTYVALRNGSENHATGLPGAVNSLMPYASGSTSKLFAASGAAFYDATSAGAATITTVTGLTSSRWSSVNIGTAGGQYLYAFCDDTALSPRIFDGTTWTTVTGVSTPAITGVTTSALRSPALWQNRLWAIERDTMKVWYLPASSIGGAATSINLGPLFRRGGKLVSIFTASLTSNTTLQEYICFLTSRGEIAAYTGTDPASSTTFSLVGVFRIGAPIGDRPVFSMDGDAIILTVDGFIKLSQLVQDRQEQDALSYKVQSLVAADIAASSANFGWQGVSFDAGSKVIVNVPTTQGSVSKQYVMNRETGAWCTFTGWNANCFTVFNDALYYGGSTVVVRADTGADDNDAQINGKLKPAFSYFGSRAQKRFTMVRPMIGTNGAINVVMSLNVDFNDTAPSSTPTYSGTGGSPWNTSPWNTSPWAASERVQTRWQSAPGVGFAGTVYMLASAKTISLKLYAIDYAMESGGAL